MPIALITPAEILSDIIPIFIPVIAPVICATRAMFFDAVAPTRAP